MARMQMSVTDALEFYRAGAGGCLNNFPSASRPISAV